MEELSLLERFFLIHGNDATLHDYYTWLRIQKVNRVKRVKSKGVK